MEMSGQLRGTAALPQGKASPHRPVGRTLGGPQSQSRRDGEERNPCLCQESNTGRPTYSFWVSGQTTLFCSPCHKLLSCET